MSAGSGSSAAPAVVISVEVDQFLRGPAGFDDSLLQKLRGLGVSDLEDLKFVEMEDLTDCGIPKIKAKRLMKIVAEGPSAPASPASGERHPPPPPQEKKQSRP